MAFLEVPFVFTATGFRGRGNREHAQTVSSMTVLRVPELTEAQAPLVARCTYQGFVPTIVDDKHAAWTPAPVKVDYRLVDGRLVRRAVPDDMFLTGAGDAPHRDGGHVGVLKMLSRPDARRFLEKWAADPSGFGEKDGQFAMNLIRATLPAGGRLPFPLLPWRRDSISETAVFQGQENLSQVTGDDLLDRARNTQRGLTGSTCLVNGALYMPSMGPGWELSRHLRDGEASRAFAVPEMGWMNWREMANSFVPGDEATCAAMGDHPTFVGEIEVVDPAALFLDPDEFAARSAARNVCNRDAASTFVETESANGLRAMADVISMTSSDASCGDRLTHALSDMAAAWDAVIPQGDPRRWRSATAREPELRMSRRREAALPAPGR